MSGSMHSFDEVAEVSISEAAEILNVSPNYVEDLIDRGEIPCQTGAFAGALMLSKVLDYKERDDQRRLAAADELIAQAQELGMGY